MKAAGNGLDEDSISLDGDVKAEVGPRPVLYLILSLIGSVVILDGDDARKTISDGVLVLELVMILVMTVLAESGELYTATIVGVTEYIGVTLYCCGEVIEKPATAELDESIDIDMLFFGSSTMSLDIDEELPGTVEVTETDSSTVSVDVDEELLGTVEVTETELDSSDEIVGSVKPPRAEDGMACLVLVIKGLEVCEVVDTGAVGSGIYREHADLRVSGAKDCNSGGVFDDVPEVDDLCTHQSQ